MEKKYELPRAFGEKWVNALRKTPDNKRIQTNYTDFKGCYCGFGLGMKAMGVDFTEQYILTPLPEGMKYIEYPITCLNDDNDASFNEQANWIEQNVTFI